jgi:hypothetical protein
MEALESRLLLSTVSWISASSGSWSTAADWSTGAVPQSTDNVVINQSGNIEVTLSSSTSVNSISVTGDTLQISGATLSVAASSSIGSSGTLLLSGATLTLASGATLSNSGLITVNPGSALSVGGAYSQTATGTLTLPAGTLSSGVAENLLTNGNFSSPTIASNSSSTTVPSNWSTFGTPYLNSQTQNVHTGSTQSLMTYGNNTGVDESFSVTPGVSYTGTVYAIDPTSAPLTGPEAAYLEVIYYTSGGTQISPYSSPNDVKILTANSTTGVWNQYTTTAVAPSNAATVQFVLDVGDYNTGISGTAGGSVFWDNAQFGPTAATAAVVTGASVSNSGTITIGMGDTVTASGTFTQTSTGILGIQLGGPPAGLLFGTLKAGGAATLAGTLSANLVNGYSPSVGDGFTLLTYASQSGTFAAYQLPSGSSYAFQPAVNPTYTGIGAVPPQPSTAINVSSAVGTSSTNFVGVNLVLWDDQMNTTETQQMVEAAGLSIFRFPGGSDSDDYHFNQSSNDGDTSANTIAQFAQFIQEVDGTGMVTTDYGSGSPQEAEAELAYLEGSPSDTTVIGNGIQWNDGTGKWQTVNWQTVGYWASLRAASPLQTNDGLNFLRIDQSAPFTQIKYWEVGNEEYGSWEIDHHGTNLPNGTSTGSQHNPSTYASFAASFASFVASDPSLASLGILIGIDSGDPTGASDSNWTKNVLTDGLADGFVPGYISDHSYMQAPGSENDSILLNDTVTDSASLLDWTTRYNDYQSLLKSTLGSSKASSVIVMATEFNSVYSDPGKQSTSLVNGLFVADSIGSLMESGYSAGIIWDLRNGWDTGNNNSSSLYGWRDGGDYGLLGDPNDSDPPSTGPYIPYPSYFAEQLASKIAQSGGKIVSAVNNYAEFSAYAVLEPNGHLDLMVINKNPDAAITEQFTLTGFNPSSQAQFWQYGEAQDYAQSQSSTGTASLANFSAMLSFTGDSFSYAFPAYSMTVIDLTPTFSVTSAAAANPNPVAGASTALSAMGSENGSGNGLTYTWSYTGPTGVTYTGNTNGTNAAQNITANFTQAGSYDFTATITDSSNNSITSSVSVTVQQTPTIITVSPSTSPVVPIGTSQQFSATATDQFGNAISSPNLTWGITGSGNSISSTGDATLGSTPGSFTVSATSGSVQGTATVIAENFAVPAGSTLDINLGTAGAVSLSASGGNITASQNGVQISFAASAFTGVTVSDTASGDTFIFNGSLSLPFTFVNCGSSTVDVAGGILTFAAVGGGTVNLGTLSVSIGASAFITAASTNNRTTLSVNSLSISGTLDVTNNEVFISYGSGPDPISSIAGWITSGYAGGAWNGTGIISSTAQTNYNYGLGYADAADANNPAGLASGQIEILYTLLGDANLDGSVNGSDFTIMAKKFNQAVPNGWDKGDFNYDGAVNGTDFTLLAKNFNQAAQIGAVVPAVKIAAAPAAAVTPAVAVAAVPAAAVTTTPIVTTTLTASTPTITTPSPAAASTATASTSTLATAASNDDDVVVSTVLGKHGKKKPGHGAVK